MAIVRDQTTYTKWSMMSQKFSLKGESNEVLHIINVTDWSADLTLGHHLKNPNVQRGDYILKNLTLSLQQDLTIFSS